MPNDAKLGLLVGVAGVVAAAVLFSQHPPPTALQPQTAAAATTAPPPAATPANPRPAARTPAPTAQVRGGRKEVVAQPTSRSTSDEDE